MEFAQVGEKDSLACSWNKGSPGKKSTCNFREVEDDNVSKTWPCSKFEKPALLGGAVNRISNRVLGPSDPEQTDGPSYIPATCWVVFWTRLKSMTQDAFMF